MSPPIGFLFYGLISQLNGTMCSTSTSRAVSSLRRRLRARWAQTALRLQSSTSGRHRCAGTSTTRPQRSQPSRFFMDSYEKDVGGRSVASSANAAFRRRSRLCRMVTHGRDSSAGCNRYWLLIAYKGDIALNTTSAEQTHSCWLITEAIGAGASPTATERGVLSHGWCAEDFHN